MTLLDSDSARASVGIEIARVRRGLSATGVQQPFRAETPALGSRDE